MLAFSPVSLKVTLEQLKRGEEKSISDCFDMELDISMNFMFEYNFHEGVRAVLIDKDNTPEWRSNSLDHVSNDYVDSFFNYSWKTKGY